jgi:hypothetical protein
VGVRAQSSSNGEVCRSLLGRRASRHGGLSWRDWNCWRLGSFVRFQSSTKLRAHSQWQARVGGSPIAVAVLAMVQSMERRFQDFVQLIVVRPGVPKGLLVLGDAVEPLVI